MHTEFSTFLRKTAETGLRSTSELRLHSAFDEIGWAGQIEEITGSMVTEGSQFEPIIISPSGTVLSGFGRWHVAVIEKQKDVHCIEYPVSDDNVLEFILTRHQLQRGWNDFVRIRLALRQKVKLQEQALANMRKGGLYKGSTNLPDAERIDVRQEIARMAGTGSGNVSKVEQILQKSHRNIITALQNGSLSIHKAWCWRELPKSEQIRAFEGFEETHTRQKLLYAISPALTSRFVDPLRVIQALQEEEARQPGSVRIRIGSSAHTEVIVGRTLVPKLNTRNEERLESIL